MRHVETIPDDPAQWDLEAGRALRLAEHRVAVGENVVLRVAVALHVEMLVGQAGDVIRQRRVALAIKGHSGVALTLLAH
jgi:hypothetical protein